MNATKFFYLTIATMALSAMPHTEALAEEVNDTTAQKSQYVVKLKGANINGRPITDKEKEVAKKMTSKGLQMASKGTHLALTALTDPAKAETLGEEMEALGEEMNTLGDSLATLSEDTTFFYEGADPDTVVLTEEDLEDVFGAWEDWGWMEKIFGGVVGFSAGMMGLCVALIVILLIFGLLTAPLWIAFILWLVVHNANKRKAKAQNVYQTTSTGQPLNGQQATGTTAQDAAPQDVGTQHLNAIAHENQEMWKSGIMYACVGVGLILLFLGIGMDGLWGIGALVTCIGVAKMIIAATTAKRYPKDNAGDYDKNQ